MTDNVVIHLDTAKLDEHINGLAGKIHDQLRFVAIAASRMMKENADIMDIYETTALINSIYFEPGGAPGNTYGKPTTPLPAPPEGGFNIGPCVDYAIWQEIGHHNVPARPFVRSTFEWMDQRYSKPEEWKKVVE